MCDQDKFIFINPERLELPLFPIKHHFHFLQKGPMLPLGELVSVEILAGKVLDGQSIHILNFILIVLEGGVPPLGVEHGGGIRLRMFPSPTHECTC